MNELLLIIRIVLSIACPIVLGTGFLDLCKFHIGYGLRLALGYLLGMAIIAYIIVACGWLGLSLSAAKSFIFIVCLVLTLKLLFNRLRMVNSPIRLQRISFSKVEFVLIVYIVLAVLYVFWTTLSAPIYACDTLTTEAMRAKIFLWNDSLDLLKYTYHPAFPLQIPLAMTWMAACLETWHDSLVALPFPIIFTVALLINYHVLRNLTSRTWALAGVALLCSSNYFLLSGTITYRDLWMMTYNAATIGMVLLWSKSQKISVLCLAGVLAGIGTFVKLEGVLYAVASSMTLLAAVKMSPLTTKEKARSILAYLIPLIGISSFYFLYKISCGIQMDEKIGILPFVELGYRAQVCLQRFIQEMFWSSNWNIIWFVLLVTLIMHWRILVKNKQGLLSLLSLILFLTFLFLTASITINYYDMLSVFTLSRVFLQLIFLPIWILIITYYAYASQTFVKRN